MISFNSQSVDQGQNTSVNCPNGDNDFENDDLITFQHNSKEIKFYYSQLIKYSKHIRELYLYSDANNRLPHEIHQFQEEYQPSSESIDYFFQLLQQNYDINEDTNMTYIQCVDLLKISKFFEIRKLSYKINEYIKGNNIYVDFVLQMIEYEIKNRSEGENQEIDLSKEIEQLLTSKINECLSNEKFKELPIHIIYRIVERSSPNSINNNKLFDIIINALNKFCVLFSFVELQKLTEDRLETLCEMYSKSTENNRHCFDYLKCNLNLIIEINKNKKDLQEKNNEQQTKIKYLETSFEKHLKESEQTNEELQKELKEQQNKMKDLEIFLQKQLKDSEQTNEELQNELKEQQNKMKEQLNELKEQQNKMKDLETTLQKQLKDSEQTNEQLQKQLNDSSNLNNEQQNKMKDLETTLQKQFNYSKDLENQISQLQKQLKPLFRIKGQITASVENGFLIKAEINLKTKGPTLDTSKSKIIISTSDANNLGIEAYDNGEPITSLHMKTIYACKAGKYYVRCIVFNSDGVFTEIVSNAVTTSISSLEFTFRERQPSKISLPRGEYKLEVWGAKGGDSTGSGYSGDRSKQSTVQGGFGGYSRGILRLNKEETVYVFVGEKGHSPNSSEGSSASGGFPDGGGAKTGHWHSCTAVPGTGGGSTSIRIGSDTNYARVIVAGGGGGASGSYHCVNPGGFGGGLSGGNCTYDKSLKNQGAGTQTGSTNGLGYYEKGDAGQFGQGATGKYQSGYDSGGGGGGGWYGGGSGGHGNSDVSSGGGGSGWTFTESSFEKWQKGDSTNASKFALDSGYYLRDDVCIGGNEEIPRPDGKGTEIGHPDNGYAKITIL